MASATQVEIKINNEKIEDFINLHLQQDLFGHHNLEIICRRDQFEKVDSIILDASDKFLGKDITVKISANTGEKNEFKGIVTGIRSNKVHDNPDNITIIAKSPDIKLDDGEHCRSFEEKTPEKIIKEIVKEYSLDTKNIKPQNSTDSMPYTVQYKESAYAFINRMAAKKGEWFFYNGTDLVFGKLPAKSVELEYGKDLLNFDFSMNLKDLKFKYVAYDYLNEKVLTSDSGKQKVSNISKKADVAKKGSDKLYSHETQMLYNNSLSESNAQSQLDNRVKLEKGGQVAGLISVSGGSDNPAIVLGCTIKIQESIYQDGGNEKKVDHGSYIITGISHFCDRTGNYQNDFKAIPDEVDVPPFTTPHAIPFCETQSAKVMDNNDPEMLGRIKVQFFWQQDENTTSPWLRMVTPHTGLDKGFYFIPEIDDEVLVAFEGGNAEKPYIIGSLYNGKAKPDTLFQAENNIKAIRTRSGHTIEFIDEDGKEELKIYDHDQRNYEITLASHSKEITIVSQGDIGIKAEGNMSIDVTGDMSMEAKGDMKIKANNIQMEANMDLELKATNAKIEAQSNYEAKGMMVKTEASTTMDVKAGAKMSINGGALLEQKGALIKIN